MAATQKQSTPHPTDWVVFAYEICSASQKDIADTQSGHPEAWDPLRAKKDQPPGQPMCCA